MNDQKIFEVVSEHLLSQSEKSMDKGDEFCAYRGDHGKKCAIGCLISDVDYDKRIEGKSLGNGEMIEYINMIMDNPNIGLLLNLQRVHDEYFVEEWRAELGKIADKYGLDIKFIEHI